jgi:malate/lactate dehydrogenase
MSMMWRTCLFGETIPLPNILTGTTPPSAQRSMCCQSDHFVCVCVFFNQLFFVNYFFHSARVSDLLTDSNYLVKEFIPAVQQRGAAVIAARKLSSALSAAKAITDHVHDWYLGTKPGQAVSMAVASDGSYNIPKGIIYSFPVVCADGDYQIVKGLHINEISRNLMDSTLKELLDERAQALGFLQSKA